MKNPRVCLLLSITAFIGVSISSCSPPKAITLSGKVTPKGQVKMGLDYSVNASNHFAKSLYNNIGSIANSKLSQDTIILDEQLVNLNKTVLAYAIEPIGAGSNYYIRYGVVKHLDVGYKYASGTHTFDGMWQFTGSTGTINEPGETKMCGSIGLQFSSKKYELPSWSGLDKVQNLLGFEMKRKDFLVPLIFSKSFGKEETFGNISFGLVYIRSFFDYGFKTNNIYDTISSTAPTAIQALNGKRNFGSTGVFLNFKLGYKYIYFLPAFAMYYQNYGSYKLIDGNTVSFKGMTFVPSLGLQINPTQIYYDSKKRRKK